MKQILELIRTWLRFLVVLEGTRGAKKEAVPFESRRIIPGGLAPASTRGRFMENRKAVLKRL